MRRLLRTQKAWAATQANLKAAEELQSALDAVEALNQKAQARMYVEQDPKCQPNSFQCRAAACGSLSTRYAALGGTTQTAEGALR